MRKILLLLTILLMGCAKEQYNAKIEYVKDFKSQYVDARGLEIWLPAQYFAHPGQRFRVLYMHDAQNVFSRNTIGGGHGWYADSIANELINTNQIDPIIIVCVDNHPQKRFIEYCPQKPIQGALEAVGKAIGEERKMVITDSVLLADNYLKFLVNEVKPYIDSTYRTLKEAKYTSICGSSMGGLISMYAVGEYPNVFGQAACLSTHWPIVFDNNDMTISQTVRDYMIEEFPVAGKHKVYFDYGTETLDQLYEIHQLKIDTIMTNKGYKRGSDWETLKFEGANHTEAAWAARFDTVLKFLYKKQ